MVSLTNFRTFSELAADSVAPTLANAQQQQQQSQEMPQKLAQASKEFQFCESAGRFFSQQDVTGKPAATASLADLKAAKQASNKKHFEIRWSNLNYQVEAKWYQKLQLTGAGSSAVGSRLGGVAPPPQLGSASARDQQAVIAERKNILNNLNGSVKSGQVTAILGPSGAGKTSLLGCLTGKNKSGVSGSVQVISVEDRLNGSSLNASNGHFNDTTQLHQEPPMSVCTIPQKDYLLNQLTVRENLWFASRLKHPDETFDHDSNIDRVVDLLKLDTCIDTKISKISGGQYKRVSIAQELLSNPDILILDEPTSGLDSLTCYKTVMVLRDLARLSPNPMAIIVTIHQPQREVFDLFNHVYILAVGGRCIYEGHPSQSIKTINECSGGLHFDTDQYNPASYLVEIASAEFGEKPIETLVEHQWRDFKRRVLEQVMSAAQPANGEQQTDAQRIQQQQHLAAIAAGLTPGLKKRSASPMIARFKSTLSSLAGKSPGNSPLTSKRAFKVPQQQRWQQQQQQQPLAYTNQAYDSSMVVGLGDAESDVSMPQQQQQQQQQQQAGYFVDTLDAGRLKVVQGDAKWNGSYDGSNNSGTSDNHLIYQHYASEQFDGPPSSAGDEVQQRGDFYLDERLQTHKHNHKGHFLRHCQLLTKRSWLCLCKDPMLTTLRFSAHIIVPLLITIVYGNKVGKPNACPLYETNMDLIEYARGGAKKLLNLQDELRCSFENVGLYFLSIYAFTFSTMCLTSLSFPLNMHVLLKEVRNGWYSIPTYFIGKTLADFPLEFILPTLTLMITYPLTGQPSSYMEWRFLLATGIFVVTSLIAQTQGLIFGALFMNAMQAAVFVAPVSTTPLILLSGFLIRISQLPSYLQKLSTLSYFRYAIESLTIIRYGFGQCPCDPSVVTGKPVRAVGVPDQLKTMTNYWLSTFENDNANNAASDYSLNESLNETITDFVTTTIVPAFAENATTEPPVDFFQDLTVLLARANSFGTDIKTCNDLKPYPMIDFSLEDNQLYVWVAALIATLFLSKFINYLVVKYSVKWRL